MQRIISFICLFGILILVFSPSRATIHASEEAVSEDTCPRQRPEADTRYNYYMDSDDNYLHRVQVRIGSHPFCATKVELSYRHTDARDSGPRSRAEDASLGASVRLRESVTVGGAVGFNQVNDGSSTEFLIGNAHVGLNLFKGTIGAGFSSDILTETSQLLHNRVRLTTASVKLNTALTDHIDLGVGYSRKFLSDTNKAHDASLFVSYKVFRDPLVTVGYRFRFLDFSKHTPSGLFDPKNYVSNRVFNSLYVERRLFYVYAEYYLGHQYYERYATSTSDFVYGGNGSVGYKSGEEIFLEVNIEGGNFAAGTAAGFSYLTVGPRVLVRF